MFPKTWISAVLLASCLAATAALAAGGAISQKGKPAFLTLTTDEGDRDGGLRRVVRSSV
jgi:hypothetical protein